MHDCLLSECVCVCVCYVCAMCVLCVLCVCVLCVSLIPNTVSTKSKLASRWDNHCDAGSTVCDGEWAS